MSKIIFPEAQTPVTLGVNVRPFYEKDNSLFEAIINGANAGVKMIFGIVALLIAVLGLVALVDLLLSTLGTRVFGLETELSLKAIFGYIFYPVTIILGVPFSDVSEISKIIGERIIVTEVVAYKDLATALGGL
jgi:CNT family concentrative nucleoside transporter